jgi:hypothetical protein
LGLRGKPPQLQVFQQAASKGRQGHSPVRVAHDPAPTVDTNRNRDGRSACRKRKRKAERWWGPSASYRAAVSFNYD